MELQQLAPPSNCIPSPASTNTQSSTPCLRLLIEICVQRISNAAYYLYTYPCALIKQTLETVLAVLRVFNFVADYYITSCVSIISR
ncbi:hypothetical protein RN001_005254 [Aquatica leii]|uniref:Uncharacterized protein n=1 Tax=Aquatica leii TaxID=1421715 RepID=A0AAN7P6C2_9COLE|nr:hypothetical protein RN001_005254 [Aquatica leii]